MRVLSTGVMTRGITDCGIAIGAAAALALGVWRVSNGAMTIEALLIVLMAGTEVFRPLRDLRAVLHQGMVGQSAAAGIQALLAGGAIDKVASPFNPGASAFCRLAGWGKAVAPTITCPGSRPPSNSTTCTSPIPAAGGRRMPGCSSRSRPARRSASSGRAGPANLQSHGCCCRCLNPAIRRGPGRRP